MMSRISNRVSKNVVEEEEAMCLYSLGDKRQQFNSIMRRVNFTSIRKIPLAFNCTTSSRSEHPLIFFLLAAITLITLFAIQTDPVEAVDCFKCSSRNGSNPACEDPFHNLNTTRITSPVLPDPQPNVVYHTPCYAGKKGREGLFPASACIKLTGTFDFTGETLVVRHCALDSGTLTQDTELDMAMILIFSHKARMSHCGKFQFEGDLLKGCVLACPEDACNSAQTSYNLSSKMLLATTLLTALVSCLKLYSTMNLVV